LRGFLNFPRRLRVRRLCCFEGGLWILNGSRGCVLLALNDQNNDEHQRGAENDNRD